MSDQQSQFDRFLAEALAPSRRAPDRRFVDRVQQHVRLDELRRANRARAVERLGIELLSLAAIGCGLAAFGASSEIADSMRQSSHLALPAMMLVFGLWVALVARPRSGDARGI